MWALRVLNGPMAGQIYNLKLGKNVVGRASATDFQINVAGISKEHIEVQVFQDKMIVTDLQSSNGTFLNGVRVQKSSIRLGDKISLDKILVDVVRAQSQPSQALVPVNKRNGGTSTHYPTALSTNANYQQLPQNVAETASPPGSPRQSPPESGTWMRLHRYMNEVVLPGLYRLLEVFEFKSVIMGFVGVFILTVTLLSLLPLNQITSESVRTESRRRAQTVARALANANEKAIRTGEMTSYSADLVLRDEGISNVYILAKDGSIMSPPEMAGMSPKGEVAGFAAQIKGQTREMSSEIGGGKIAASCPILIFDPELQQNVAKAHAVVIYDTETLKFDDKRALSLFIQMLCISLIVGGSLFFLMYKLIEYPFFRLNQEIDSALRESRDHAEVPLKFPMLQNTLVTINSLLTRVQQGHGGASHAHPNPLRDQEWMNLTQLVGYPAMLLSKEMVVVSLNAAFESLTGANGHSLQGQPLQYLPDQAMQKNIEELMKQSNNNTTQVQSDKLEISGTLFNLQCQAITVAGDAKYFLVTIMPVDESMAGGAA